MEIFTESSVIAIGLTACSLYTSEGVIVLLDNHS